jgi:hypothetical protein
MAKKSKRFAARQSASTKRKKGKPSLSQRQIELSGVSAPTPTPPPAADSTGTDAPVLASTEAPESGSSSETPEQAAQPGPQVAVPAAAGAPWRYGYVLTDVRRIGLITVVVALLLGVLTFFLR